MLSIVVVGFTITATLFFPLVFLARWFPWARSVSGWVLQKGIRFLMLLQPWFKADVKIDLPRNGRGTLIVSNHRSILDVFILLSRVPGIRLMTRNNGLYKIPYFGWVMIASRHFRVERGQADSWVEAMENVRVSLEHGDTVHIFPEMTRCPLGYQGLQSFVSGPFLTAIKSHAQVVPMIFDNTDGAWPKGQSGINFGAPIRVRTLAPLQAAEFATADQLNHTVREKMLEAMA